MPKKEKFTLENLSNLSKEQVEREDELKELAERDKKSAKKIQERHNRRQELEFNKTISERVEESEQTELEEMATKERVQKLRREVMEEKPSGRIEKKLTAKERAEEEEFDRILEERIDELQAKSGMELGKEKEKKKIEKVMEAAVAEHGQEDVVSKRVRTFYDEQIRQTLKITPTAFKEIFSANIRKNINVAEYGRTEDARERAQEIVDEEIESIIRQYETSLDMINGADKKRENSANLLSSKYDFDIESRGMFGGVKKFFKGLMIKRKLNKKEKAEFDGAKTAYKDSTKFYKHWMKNHTKRFGKIENSVEEGMGADRRAIGIIARAFSVGGGMPGAGLGMKMRG